VYKLKNKGYDMAVVAETGPQADSGSAETAEIDELALRAARLYDLKLAEFINAGGPEERVITEAELDQNVLFGLISAA
jgi:hypothetical protein